MLTTKYHLPLWTSLRPDPRLCGKRLNLGRGTRVMGILNVTPDSFSDAGMFFDRTSAVERGLKIAEEGADIIDIGGESTRPGATEIGPAEEAGRVIPVIEALARKVKIPISVDTRKAIVAEKAIKAGASIINDISGLKHDLAMAGVAAKSGAAVIVMHMKGSPADMQFDPRYGDLIPEIIESLKRSLDIARKAGIARDKIIIDPGIGFGKTVEHNFEILRRLREFKALGRPICVGTSRKSFIRKSIGSHEQDHIIAGSLATCVIAMENGADILRVHDVAQTVCAVKMVDAMA